MQTRKLVELKDQAYDIYKIYSKEIIHCFRDFVTILAHPVTNFLANRP